MCCFKGYAEPPRAFKKRADLSRDAGLGVVRRLICAEQTGQELQVEQRPLGRTGRTIPAIALGCVTFGREISEDDSYRVMDYAMEKGLNFFDTAEAYGGGNSQRTRLETMGVDDQREVTTEMSSSENIVGRWMEKRGARDDIILMTKFSTGGSADNVHRALAESLERLRTNHVDIYKLHRPYPDVPVDETLGALADEVAAGRTEVIGCSQHSAQQLREALATSAAKGYPRYEITQPGYNLGPAGRRGRVPAPLHRGGDLGHAVQPDGRGLLHGQVHAGPRGHTEGHPLRHHARPRGHLLQRPQLPDHREAAREGRTRWACPW